MDKTQFPVLRLREVVIIARYIYRPGFNQRAFDRTYPPFVTVNKGQTVGKTA